MATFYVTETTSIYVSSGLTLGVPFYVEMASPSGCFGSFTLARLGPTSWRATFVSPVYDTPPLRLRECYVFSPALTVHSVTPTVDSGTGHITSVDIVTSEQGPITYTLTIYGTEVVS